jgi:hypothetical protein
VVLREVRYSTLFVNGNTNVRFDSEGFSIWRIDFKYNDELTQVFMSSNQVGGFFNRLEASRKYLFGSVGVCGKANDSIITGSLICRGQDIKPVVEVAPDCMFYSIIRGLQLTSQGSLTCSSDSTSPTRRTRLTSRVPWLGSSPLTARSGPTERTSSKRQYRRMRRS